MQTRSIVFTSCRLWLLAWETAARAHTHAKECELLLEILPLFTKHIIGFLSVQVFKHYKAVCLIFTHSNSS